MPDTVLIIDDEPGISAALSIRLRAAGFEVLSAMNGRGGIARAESDRPDIILLDIRLPDIDGFQVNRELKGRPDLASIPVVFLSANVRDSARQAAVTGGAVAFLSKPYESAEVVATLKQALAGAAATSPSEGEHP